MNNLEIKKVNNKDDLEKVIEIRKNVFIKEQNVPLDIEIDGLDSEAEHFIVYLDDEPIGCARVRVDNRIAKLERIAIIKRYRGKGFGKKLTKFLINYCREKNFNEIFLHSQTNVTEFYEKIGFKVRGEPFFEADIEHMEMYLDIS